MPQIKNKHKRNIRQGEKPPENESSQILLLTLENNKRYAHTASCSYQITMASLQPDSRRLPNCACSVINEERSKPTSDQEKVIVIIEHDLKEYILCVLILNKQNSCKLNLFIQPGEQIAFRTIGKIPVLLSGISSEAH